MTTAQIAILVGFLAVLALLIFASSRSARVRTITRRSSSETTATTTSASSADCGSSDGGGGGCD